MYAPTTETAAADAVTSAPLPAFLTPENVVEILGGGITPRQVRGWIARGVLRGSNPTRGVWLVNSRDFEAWIDNGMRRTRPDAAPRARRAGAAEPIDPARTRARGISRRKAKTTTMQLN